jgi:cytoskeletal protein CcmA (bactofilin family)
MADTQSDPDPRRRFTDERQATSSIIGRDVRIEGELAGTTDIEIWGSFEGAMTVDGLVWMRPGSRFAGELTTINLVIEGELQGTVRAAGRVDMRASCRIEADVTAGSIAAAEGSQIEGRITVSGRNDEVVSYSERRGQ